MTENLPSVKEEFCFETVLRDVQNMQNLCTQLLKTKHYMGIGEAGIFAIIQKAKSLGMSPLDALNGGIYYVNGKTELSSNSMNYLIRAAGHSISKDPKSDKTCCILHGKRKDNGDTWTTSFSIEDAKKAGIYKNTWEKYGEDMVFARALSRLARQLFPDVLKGAYTEGEIRDGVIDNPRSVGDMKVEETVELISAEKANQLKELLTKCTSDYAQKFNVFIKQAYKITDLSDLPLKFYDRTQKSMLKNIEDVEAILLQAAMQREEPKEIEEVASE